MNKKQVKDLVKIVVPVVVIVGGFIACCLLPKVNVDEVIEQLPKE